MKLRTDSVAELEQVREQILELVYEQVSRLMDTRNMYIALYDETTNTVSFELAMQDGQPVPVGQGSLAPRKAGKGATEEVIHTKTPLLLKTKKEAEEWYARPEHEGYIGQVPNGWLGVPMIAGDKVLGVIALRNFEQDNAYDQNDLDILSTIASQAVIALDNATLYYEVNRKLEHRIEQLETVQEISNAIETHAELPAFLQSILDFSLPRLGAQAGTIQLLDKVTNELVVIAQIGPVIEKRSARIPLSQGVTGQAAREKRPIYIPDTSKSEAYLSYFGQTRSELAVPLVLGDEVIGVFNVEAPRLNAFDEDEQELCELIAAQVAVAIRQKMRLEEEQGKRIQAEKDALLGKLTADIAHHVKNKVGLVRLAAINLLNDPTIAESPSSRKEVEKILRSAEATGKLASDLFEPYRETEPELVDVGWLIEDAVISVEVPDDVELATDISRDLPQVVIERQGAVNVFQELLVNALRAVKARKEPRWIKISSRLSIEGYVELLFSNSGPLIPKKRWEAIFEQFAVADERMGTGKGFGLGLWSARTFLRRQGGDIRVLESGDVKTTFIVRLPTSPWEEYQQWLP